MENEIREIPDFTKEQYLKTTEPFEWLYKYKDNKFLLAQALEEIREKAGACGVKSFVSMWKNYLQEKNTKNYDISYNATEFTGQSLELICGDWICDDTGVYGTDRMGFDIVACNHPILPIKRLVNIDSGAEKLELAYKKSGRPWRTIIMDKKTLASANSIISLAEYGIAVNSENSKYLVKFLADIENMNPEAIPECSSVGRLGWVEGYGFSPYMDNLIFDGDLIYKKYYSSIKKKGSYEKWLDLVSEIRKGDTIVRIMLAASFSSVLINPCSGLSYFVHLWGGTEAGKTIALMLATSVWGSPIKGDYWHTFKSTTVGEELTAAFFNSMPLIIDELQVISDKKSFDTMVYELCEGIGKVRGAKNGGLQSVPTWENCFLTSGEMPVSTSSSGGGAVNRIIEIECEGKRFFSNPIKVINTLTNNYGFAGRMFVEKLMEEDNIKQAREIREFFYKRLMDGGKTTEKQAMAASLILTADELINDWIFRDNRYLMVEDIEDFLSSKKDVSSEERAYDFILDYVTMNFNKFGENVSGDMYGIIDKANEEVFIIKTQFDKIMRDEGFSPASFLSWAKRKKIIRTKDGRKTINKKIHGVVCYCVCLKMKKISLDEELGFYDS